MENYLKFINVIHTIRKWDEKGIFDVLPAGKMAHSFGFSSHFSRAQNTDLSLLTETLATQASNVTLVVLIS